MSNKLNQFIKTEVDKYKNIDKEFVFTILLHELNYENLFIIDKPRFELDKIDNTTQSYTVSDYNSNIITLLNNNKNKSVFLYLYESDLKNNKIRCCII